jgi:rhodanese-related sulfurtransferase
MPALNTISSDKLYRLVGIPNGPAIVDVRAPDAFGADPHLLPASLRRVHNQVSDWAGELCGRSAVIVCRDGALAHGVAAWLRHEGIAAETLDGGIAGWAEAGLPLIPEGKLPARDPRGRTIWVTRARPKVDRIACPWLVRRFVDPAAVFLFVPTGEVAAVAEAFAAAPFDVDAEGVIWSHRGDLCTFDVMLTELGLDTIAPLALLAPIVRGADTARPELAPQAAGLLAASLGLSRMYADDLEQLEAGMLLYDAFYRWCRDAAGETHDWVSHTPRRKGA